MEFFKLLRNLSFFPLFFLLFNVVSAYIELYQVNSDLKNNYFFVLVYLDKNNSKIIPNNCNLSIDFRSNETFNLDKCYAVLKTNKILDNIEVFANYVVDGINYNEKKIFKVKNNLNDKIIISPDNLILNGKQRLKIKVPYKGYLYTGKERFFLEKGENLILFEKIYKEGPLKLKIELCDDFGNCKNFYRSIFIKKSPVKCFINYTNNFPYNTTLHLKVFDQDGKEYRAKLFYVDSEILPVEIGDNYLIKFPIFYPAKNYSISFYIDGKECKTIIPLSYDKFFYAYYDEIEQKINKINVFLQNPYDISLNLSVKVNNSSIINISLDKYENKKLVLPYRDYYEILFNNKSIYKFKAELVKNEKFKETIQKIRKSIFIILIVIVIFVSIIWLLPLKD